MVHAPLESTTVIPAIKAAAYESGSDQPVYNVQTMRQIVSESMSSQRFPMILLGVFAGLALLLASVGIYGVIYPRVLRPASARNREGVLPSSKK